MDRHVGATFHCAMDTDTRNSVVRVRHSNEDKLFRSYAKGKGRSQRAIRGAKCAAMSDNVPKYVHVGTCSHVVIRLSYSQRSRIEDERVCVLS